MQLVQTSAHDVRIEARKIEKKRQANFALKRQESFSESHPSQARPFLDEVDHDVRFLFVDMHSPYLQMTGNSSVRQCS